MKGMEHRRPLGGRARASLRDHAPDSMVGEADYLADRLEGALRAVCLTSQSGLLSAIANDTAGDMGMAQQLHGYGRPGDLFWALSTSGTSRNVVLASLTARASGMRVLALTGAAGERLGGLADVWVPVPATDVADVQELHQPLYHALCSALEERYWPRGAEPRARDVRPYARRPPAVTIPPHGTRPGAGRGPADVVDAPILAVPRIEASSVELRGVQEVR